MTAEDTRGVMPRTRTKHPLLRGQGGEIAAQHYPFWDKLEGHTWAHDEELKQPDNCVVRYRAGGLVQVKGAKRNE